MAAAASTTIGVREDWYALDTADVARELAVDPEQGLSADEARSRLETSWPQPARGGQEGVRVPRLPAPVPGLHADHPVGGRRDQRARHGRHRDDGPAGGAHRVQRAIGLRQESKAEASVEALSKMMKTIARCSPWRPGDRDRRRGAGPGDVVLVEAGNRILADGSICVAATLEIEEAALTGESLPVGKEIAPVTGENVPLGGPHLHGVHEHVRHARARGVRGHRDRHGDRDRPHRRHAREHRVREDAAPEAARQPVQDHRDHRRYRARARRPARAACATSRSTRCSSPA